MEEQSTKPTKKHRRFWTWLTASVLFRLILIYFPQNLNLSSRPEVSTPLTSLRRLAEGYWLKQSSMSPYAGSMYHGSPLLLSLLGPLTVQRIDGLPSHLLCSLVFVAADVLNSLLIRATGQTLQIAYRQSLKSLDLDMISETMETLPSGDIAALIYLWNPFTIAACVGLSTSPIENLAVMLALYGACKRLVPLAAFGWVMATHLSLYPIILVIPIILLLGNGPDTPRQLFLLRRHAYVLLLCGVSVKQYGGLWEMFTSMYGFILTVQDLSPNIGVLWYFFAEVFDFFRNFFLIVFQMNILFMIFPLAIRLHHRPCFLAFVYITISSMLKSYPSVGDSALYLGFLGWFVYELSEMKFSFFLFCVYVGVSLLSPVMHNLWIWRGTGNANFYFATAMAYACLQIVLVVESVSGMLNHDRKLRNLSSAKLQDGKS
ncbi:hypothetical protein ACLB2K_048569 [Fragaria x ananassa]